MMIQATRPISYAGKFYRAGDTFEVNSKEGKFLKKINRAIDPPAPEPAPEPVVEVAPVVPMTTENSAPIVPTRRGRYARRDMRSEESSADDSPEMTAPDESDEVE